jgi:hypothetical protein
MSETDDKIISIDEARELVSDQVLWPRVRDFLWDFAPSIHESWIEGMFGSLEVSKFWDRQTSKLPSIQTSRHLKKALLASLGVEPCFHTFPKDDGSRLLLLDGATLESMAKWMGALACAEQLRRVTDGATVRSLKAALPGIYPEVFGFAAYFGKWKVESGEWKANGVDAGSKVVAAGRQILFSVLSSLPAQLLRRLELKIPKNTLTSDADTASEIPAPSFDYQFVLKLLKLKFPEAYSLCC